MPRFHSPRKQDQYLVLKHTAKLVAAGRWAWKQREVEKSQLTDVERAKFKDLMGQKEHYLFVVKRKEIQEEVEKKPNEVALENKIAGIAAVDSQLSFTR